MEILREIDFECPYCGETITSTVDTSEGDYSTIEDCSVCCQPIQLVVHCAPGEVTGVEASPA
jgi:transcription elongation factor Elf1